MSEVTALDFMNLLRRVEKLEKMDTPRGGYLKRY